MDILYEENHFAKLCQKEIKNDLIITTGIPIYVKMPTPESLLGDKLTAFAPKTIGVKPITIKDNGNIVDKKIETIKQFLDVASLFDVVNNFNEVIESYNKSAYFELKYRGLNLTIENCLLDTFRAAASIMSRGKIDSIDYKNYLIGIQGLRGYLIDFKFNAENAKFYAAKVMYLVACIIKEKAIEKIIPDQEFIQGEYSKLNFLKKIDIVSFNMAAYAISILNNNQ